MTDQSQVSCFDVEKLLRALTLEEKAGLMSGSSPWHLKSVPRLGIPEVMLADGPHGLRKQAATDDFGVAEPATCFPPAVTLGSTWDTELVARVGVALGREARASGVAVLLGPGINIKRSPLCGRNFEYFSEDPVVAGDLAAALIAGIQSQKVGTSLKHFAANNQESDRMRVSVDVDERTLREIYLAGFERAVTKASPWTVMCAYNRINGVHASQNHWLLTEVLRQEWGFDGAVVSDWGAVHDRVAALSAGLDLEMPSSGGRTDAQVVAAVRDGTLDESVLDAGVRRVLRLIERALANGSEPHSFDTEAHHALAREAATGGAVLLRNKIVEGSPLLPLDPAQAKRLVILGEFARTPRYQGAGSSQVNPTRLDDALSAIRELTETEVAFAPGFTLATGTDHAAREETSRLHNEAVSLARTADTVLLFLGLPETAESEGYDRSHMDLPTEQLTLLSAVADICPRLVVVLANGSAVSIAPWRGRTGAILEAWLGGQAGGGAVADLLYGVHSPSGRVSETLPLRLTDTASCGNFPGELGHVRYGEGVLVGYRYHDAKQMEVAYPFGHGLSYTTFTHTDLTATVMGTGANTEVVITAWITNTGNHAGAEVVQVYVGGPPAPVMRPERELKAFTKVHLEPGQEAQVTLRLGARDLSYWNSATRDWTLESGRVTIWIGASSRDLRGAAEVTVTGDARPAPLTEWSTLAEALAHPVIGPVVLDAVTADPIAGLNQQVLTMNLDIPLVVIAGFDGFDGMSISRLELDALLQRADSAPVVPR